MLDFPIRQSMLVVVVGIGKRQLFALYILSVVVPEKQSSFCYGAVIILEFVREPALNCGGV
jgi:hypothetical protein